MDTRTERFIENPMRQIISDYQMQALKSWLLAPNPGVKFIVSSVPFFPDQKDMSKDKWSGFDQQRIEILDLIRDNEIAKVVFLSGDIHCSMSSKLTCSTHPNLNIHSIISSSFFWPYPQGQAHIYKRSGTLTQSGSCNYEVSYTGKVHSDDNFTRINVNPNGLNVEVYNRKGKQLGSENFVF
jgi:alkaline phosphatase D